MPFLARLFCAGALLWGCALVAGDRNEAWADGAQRHTTLRGTDATGEFATGEFASLVQTRQKTRRSSSREPEQLEQWKDSHQAVDGEPSAFLEGGVAEVGAKAYAGELHDLTDSYQSRFVGTSGNVDISHKIADKFRKLGLDVRVEGLSKSGAVSKYLSEATKERVGGNVIGVLKGSDLAHEVVIVGAHYDSVNWEQTTGKAPGIDDNGSGSALVQLVARHFHKHKVQPRRTLMFVGFNTEEEGLVGSDQMAKRAARGDYGNIKAVLIADEVAYPGVGSGRKKAIFETLGSVPGTSSLVDTLAKNAQVNGGDGIAGFEVNKHGFGSDHMSFLQVKIPSVLLIERDNIAHADAYGHSDRDTWDHVDSDYGAAMTRLMIRTTSALGSPAWPPRNNSFQPATRSRPSHGLKRAKRARDLLAGLGNM